jgi:Uma2 family endonuclease
MSTVTDPQAKPLPGSVDDPYRYGWRDVCETRPDGSQKWTRVPLTLEDVLHPQMGDHILESDLHSLLRDYLAGVCRVRAYAADPTAYVTSNSGVYWDDPALDHHCPDVGVIFGVRNRSVLRTSFQVATEGTWPRLIIELVSPHTRSNDVDTKLREYHRARVQRYVILDRLTENASWELRGYQYTPPAYVDIQKDVHGRLWLEDVGVWLATKGQRVICYDPITNEAIGDYAEITELMQQVRRQAEAEKARAEAEKARAEAEKARAETAETRIRQLEEQLRQRGGNGRS